MKTFSHTHTHTLIIITSFSKVVRLYNSVINNFLVSKLMLTVAHVAVTAVAYHQQFTESVITVTTMNALMSLNKRS